MKLEVYGHELLGHRVVGQPVSDEGADKLARRGSFKSEG